MVTRLMNYAQIGKGELIQAIGVAENRKHFSGIELDVDEKTGECTSKILFGEKSKEAEKYGDKERLAAIPLMFWLYLHYLSPDKEGLVRDVSLRDAADTIGCSSKAVRNAVKTLSDAGYIYASTIYCGVVTVMLAQYRNYFNDRENSGTGYVEISSENFLSLVSIVSDRKKRALKREDEQYKDNSLVNKLRLKLRCILMCDQSLHMFAAGKKAGASVLKTVDEMLSYLPGYIYGKKMLSLLKESFSDILRVEVEEEKKSVKITPLYNDFSGRQDREDQLLSMKQDVERILMRKNSAIHQFNSSKDPLDLIEEGIYMPYEDVDLAMPLRYEKDDLKDLAVLALNYGTGLFEDAISYVYSHFVLSNRKINSLGALMQRTMQSYSF